MRETQRGFIPVIVAVLLGLAAIGGGVALTIGHQGSSKAEIIKPTEQVAAVANVATMTEAEAKQTVTPKSAAVETEQKEVDTIDIGVSSTGGFVSSGGSGGSGETYTPPVQEQQKQQYSGPTSAQIAGALLLCADARIAHICNQTFWDGYMTNRVFRKEVDALVIQYQHQNEQARLAAQLQQQKNCGAWMDAISPLLAGMSPEASVSAQKSSMAACSGMQYDDTAHQMSEIKEDVEDLKEIACPPGNNKIECIGL